MSPDDRNSTSGSPADLTLRQVLTRLSRRWASLVVLPLVVGALAVAGSYLLPDEYLPQAIVSIEQPRRRAGDPLVPLDTLVQNSRYLLQSYNLHRPVIERIAVDTGVNFSPEVFRSRLSASVPRESQLLFIGFQHTDPALATRVANALAEAVTESVNAFNRAEVNRFLARYLEDIETARASVLATAAALEAFQLQSQLELLEERIEVASEHRSVLEGELLQTDLAIALLRADPIAQTLAAVEGERQGLQDDIHLPVLTNEREALLDQQRALQTSLTQAVIDLEAARETLSALETELASQDQRIDLRRAMADEPMLQQAAASAAGVDLAEILSLSLTVETLNPVHSETLSQVVEERARVAELERRRIELSSHLDAATADVVSVDAAINRGTLLLERAERAVELGDQEYRERHVTSLPGLSTVRTLTLGEMTALSASIEALRSRQYSDSAQFRLLEQDWTLALERLERFTDELSTATLNILEAMPTLAVRSPAIQPTEPVGKERRMILLAGLALGFAVALGRAYLLEF